jgi:hypothetical protein
MSNKIVLRDSKYYTDWLEKSIEEEHIIYYEYTDFKNIQKIGVGLYGNVMRANWKNRFFALKIFDYDKITLKGIVNEVRHLQLFKGSF